MLEFETKNTTWKIEELAEFQTCHCISLGVQRTPHQSDSTMYQTNYI